MGPGEEGYDPFEISSSQEEILKNCGFARESETFPDSNPDWMASSSRGWTSPVPTQGITMVSPPDSGTPREDDNYHTPPEHYYSLSSDSDDAQQPPPPPGTTLCGDDDGEPMTVDMGEEEEENLEFLLSQLDQSSRDEGRVEGCNCVIKDHEMEVLPGELDRNSVLEGEFCENAAKKNRVCKGNSGLGIDTVCVDETMENLDTEIIDLDSEKSDDDIEYDKQRVCIDVVPVEKELSEGDGVCEGVDLFENEENCGGNSKGENLFQDGEGGGRGGEGENFRRIEILLSGGGRNGKSENLGSFKNCVRDNEISKGEKSYKTGESSKGGHLSENRRESDSISRGKRLQSNDEEGGELEKDNSSKCGSDSVGCAAKKSGSNREQALREALETIEKFKYVGSSGSMERRGKKKSVLGKSELPLPMIGKKNGVQEKVEDENDGMKGGSLKDLLGTLKSIMEKPNDGSKHDFLETAKRRGVVFPRPRWWPPEGSDDDYTMA